MNTPVHYSVAFGVMPHGVENNCSMNGKQINEKEALAVTINGGIAVMNGVAQGHVHSCFIYSLFSIDGISYWYRSSSIQ